MLKERAHVRTRKAHRVNLRSAASQGFAEHLIRELFVTRAHASEHVVSDPFIRVAAVREGFAHGDGKQPLVEALAFFQVHVLCHVYGIVRELADLYYRVLTGRLAIKEEEQCVRFDRIQKAVIISHTKTVTCITVGVGGEEPVPLLLALERPMLHEEAIELRTNSVRSRVALMIEDSGRRLVARNVRHNLTGLDKTYGQNVGQSRCKTFEQAVG